MSAEFKSHILRRDEKGFFGIPLKRLLLAGVGGGLGYTVIQMLLRQASVPLGIMLAVALLILTGTRGGIPLWQRLGYRLRGSVLITAARRPQSLAAKAASAWRLPLQLIQIDSALLFAAGDDRGIDLREWITFAHARDSEADALSFVSTPGEIEILDGI